MSVEHPSPAHYHLPPPNAIIDSKLIGTVGAPAGWCSGSVKSTGLGNQGCGFVAMSRVAREVVEAVVLALIVFLVIQTGVRNFKVEGASMQPTLHGGQFLLVNKLVYFKLDTARISCIVPF